MCVYACVCVCVCVCMLVSVRVHVYVKVCVCVYVFFSHIIITLLSFNFCCFVSFLLTSNLHLDSLFLPARDLDKLREEFWHQQMKIDEMNFLKQSLDAEGIL